jgi:hydrogenase maturation protease
VALLVGYGNPARTDDALGWELAKSLAQGLSCADLRLTQQLGPELALEMAGHRLVLLADASSGGPAVLLRRLGAGPEAKVEATSHHTGPETLLSLARTLFKARCECWLLTVRGERMGMGEGLSPQAQARLKAALSLARPLLERDDA